MFDKETYRILAAISIYSGTIGFYFLKKCKSRRMQLDWLIVKRK
ncbi:hypothetical protein [Bacillus pumilus]|nr:hypothetical protein [Bacillus pumilus]UUD41130.1 hypothetical protein NPA43_09620 [Bacillus pumilus]